MINIVFLCVISFLVHNIAIPLHAGTNDKEDHSTPSPAPSSPINPSKPDYKAVSYLYGALVSGIGGGIAGQFFTQACFASYEYHKKHETGAYPVIEERMQNQLHYSGIVALAFLYCMFTCLKKITPVMRH